MTLPLQQAGEYTNFMRFTGGESPRREAGGDDVRVRGGVLLEEVVLAAVAGERGRWTP